MSDEIETEGEPLRQLAPAIETGPPPAAKKRRLGRIITSVIVGLVGGLALAEAAFWLRDDGAFPHVNVYVADEDLGVRLVPGATQNLKFRDNPTTEIRINQSGHRGADWSAPGEGEILVVGDSQVFGLGVEADETLSAVLAELTGRPTLNGGIPTYGPLEYNAVVEEVLAERSPTTVVYVVNMANDLFETHRPNRARHAVWDGWAVRAETAPDTITIFPGRDLLYQKSHLFYALRRLMQGNAPTGGDLGLPSEGGWQDLVHSGDDSEVAHEGADHALRVAAIHQRQRLSKLDLQLDDVEGRIDDLIYQHNQDQFGYEQDVADNYLRIQAARANPADIVLAENVEEGRAIKLTARIIRHAVRFRDRLISRTRDGDGAEPMDQVVTERTRLETQRAEALGTAVARTPIPSVLAPRLAEVAAICEEHDAELVVVALPLDVMVSADEWAKYGVEPIDMEPTRILSTDLIATAARLGARGVDPTEALRAVEPGAFLDGDLHLTPAGQRAVAEAVTAALAEPPPLRVPNSGIPDERSRVPEPLEWIHTPEAIVRGSSAARCETVRLHEWLRVSCMREGRRHVPSGVELVDGGLGEALMVTTGKAATLVAPIFAGLGLVADFFWEDRRQRLIVDWPADEEEPTMRFEEAVEEDGRPFARDADSQRLCECYEEVTEEVVCTIVDGWPTEDCAPTCANLYGSPSPECFSAYRDSCEDLLRCVRGDPVMMPPCPDGTANAGATGHCFPLCSEARPCESGRCVDWQGAEICRP